MKLQISLFILSVFSMNMMFLMFKLKHMLMVLLMFELLGLNFLVFFMFTKFFMKKTMGLMMLVLLACEASLGLSILVGMMRYNYLNYVIHYKFFNI